MIVTSNSIQLFFQKNAYFNNNLKIVSYRQYRTRPSKKITKHKIVYIDLYAIQNSIRRSQFGRKLRKELFLNVQKTY